MCVFTSVQQLTGEAKFSDGTIAEPAIELTFEVVDDNDNPPVFSRIPPATVKESSPAGKNMLSANNTQKIQMICIRLFSLIDSRH